MVGPYPLPGTTAAGGVEAVMATLVPALVERGVEMTVVTCSPDVARAERFEQDGIAYEVLPTDRARARLTWFALERRAITAALRRLRPDVAHVQGANFFGPATVAAGLPTVVTLHGIYYKEAHITDAASGVRERSLKRLRGAGNTHFERVTLHHATELIIISAYVEEAVVDRTSARLHAIPNPVPAEFYCVERNPVRGRILFVGSIEPRKNVLSLVNAFHAIAARTPEAHLRLVGRPADAEYHRTVMAALASGEGAASAQYLGVLSQDELLAEYASASVLVLPSREESSPMAIQQAMAAALPVVASRAGGIDRLVRHGETGLLVAPGDEEQLGAAMVDLATSDRAPTMGEAARAAAEQFRHPAVASATHDVYDEVVRRFRPVAR